MCFSSGIWHYHLLLTPQKVRTKNKGENILNFVRGEENILQMRMNGVLAFKFQEYT